MSKKGKYINENRGYELAKAFLRDLGRSHEILPEGASRDQLVLGFGPCPPDGPMTYAAPEIDYGDFYTCTVYLPHDRPEKATVYIEVLVNKYSEHVHVHYAPYMRKRDKPLGS